MTLDSRDGHVQNPGDVGGVEVFLIAEDYDHARRFRKRGNQALQGFGKQGVASGGNGGGFGHVGERDLGTATAAAGFIDGALDGHFTKPVGGVLGGLDGGEVAMEGEENILSDLVGERAVVEEMPADTKNHGLMALDEAGKIESVLRRVFQNSHGRKLREAFTRYINEYGAEWRRGGRFDEEGTEVIFEQFYLGCLAHASYLIGSEGVAAVVDPQRDVDIYLDAAARLGVKIEHVIETHLHADFVSGHGELAARTGATIYLGKGSGATFPHRAVGDGDAIEMGKCRLEFLQTPGHTMESISAVVKDRERGDAPYAVLTGDTLFIGDVGRPDLSDTKTPAELARMLYHSLRRKLLTLPDEVLVYPAHGAGSMCGRNIGKERSSTIGRERRTNYALQPMGEEQFVATMTEDLPPRPEYFGQDVAMNRRGAPALESLPALRALPATEVRKLHEEGVTLLDTRPAAEYLSGHALGSIHIGLGGQFAAWAGVVIGLEQDVILVSENRQTAEEARMRLARVGIERVAGILEGGVAGWARAGLELGMIDQITVHELKEQRGELLVVDVRGPREWSSGHIPGALLQPLDKLKIGMEELDRRRAMALHCKGGYRSAIACSLLEAAGFEQPINVIGGYDAWVAAGFETE